MSEHAHIPPPEPSWASCMRYEVPGGVVDIVQGGITDAVVDVIVNAANSSLLGGGGVDGAIHRAAGPALLNACHEVRARQGRCPTGEAVITTAGNLRARHVIHTVGPVWRGGEADEPGQLFLCYARSMALAHAHNARSIAFPAISTGAYRYPLADASEIASLAVLQALAAGMSVQRVIFVLFRERELVVFHEAFERVLHGRAFTNPPEGGR